MACTYVNKSTYEIIIYIYVERERDEYIYKELYDLYAKG